LGSKEMSMGKGKGPEHRTRSDTVSRRNMSGREKKGEKNVMPEKGGGRRVFRERGEEKVIVQKGGED